jgi:hypothetical protein
MQQYAASDGRKRKTRQARHECPGKNRGAQQQKRSEANHENLRLMRSVDRAIENNVEGIVLRA